MVFISQNHKQCSKCKETKPIDDFHKRKDKKDGLATRCKQCKISIDKQYRELNQEAIKESKRQYRQTNKDALKHQTKTRMKTDNVFSLTRRIRKSINQSFANNGYTKKSRSYEILGCSFEEFKVYIENQFLAGMHWDNRSEWHLDHIVPVSFSESEDEIIMLNHYTNFRPLWAFDNISKHAKLTEEALEHPIYKRIIEQRSNNPN